MAEISGYEARKLRAVFQGPAGTEMEDAGIDGDYVDLRVRYGADGSTLETFLCIHKDGEQVARCVIAGSNLKKFQRDIQKIRDTLRTAKIR